MSTPGFTAEASLSKTSGHYRTHRARQAVSSSAQMMSPIYPALFQRPETVEMHGCPPGWTDYGGTCFPPPVTEPPVGGGGGGGVPPGGGPEDGGPGGGEPYGGKFEVVQRLKSQGGRWCLPDDFPGRDVGTAEQDCAKKSKPDKGVLRQLVCFNNPDGTKYSSCCFVYLKKVKGKITGDIDLVVCTHAEEVPPT
jgi:hypothetical protein